MQILKAHRGRVHGLTFSPDGTRLASIGGRGRAISMWRLGGKPRRGYLSGHNWPVKQVEFSPDGVMLFSVDAFSAPAFWDVAGAKRIQVKVQANFARMWYGWCRLYFRSQCSEIIGLAVGSRAYFICSWVVQSQRDGNLVAQVCPEVTHQLNGWGVAFAVFNAGQLAAAGFRHARPSSNWVDLWRDGKLLATLNVKETIHDLAFTPDGGTLAVAAGTKVYLCRVPDAPLAEPLEPESVLRGHERIVTAVRPTADGNHLFTGSTDGQVKIWDSAHRKEVAAFDWEIGPVHSLALAADGMRAAAGGAGGEVIIWDVDL